MLCGYSREQCRLITVPNYFVDLQHHLNKINSWKTMKKHIQQFEMRRKSLWREKKKETSFALTPYRTADLKNAVIRYQWHLELQSHALPLSYQGFESRTSGRPGADLLKKWIKPELLTIPEVMTYGRSYDVWLSYQSASKLWYGIIISNPFLIEMCDTLHHAISYLRILDAWRTRSTCRLRATRSLTLQELHLGLKGILCSCDKN